jgi:hypothetical protein
MLSLSLMLVASLVAAAIVTPEATAPPDDATAPAPAAEDAFTGKFRFVGGKRQRDRVAEAIESAVESLPAFHGLARKRLTAANTIPGSVTMKMDGKDLVVVYGDREPQRAPLDGSVREWRGDEGKVKLKHELRGGKLVQTTWGDGGRRVMVWTLDEAGRLSVHSTMSSSRLPVPVRYRLSFKKR